MNFYLNLKIKIDFEIITMFNDIQRLLIRGEVIVFAPRLSGGERGVDASPQRQMLSLIMQRDAETYINGLIRNTYGILMMPALDSVSRREICSDTLRDQFQATYSDRFKCILASSRTSLNTRVNTFMFSVSVTVNQYVPTLYLQIYVLLINIFRTWHTL